MSDNVKEIWTDAIKCKLLLCPQTKIKMETIHNQQDMLSFINSFIFGSIWWMCVRKTAKNTKKKRAKITQIASVHRALILSPFVRSMCSWFVVGVGFYLKIRHLRLWKNVQLFSAPKNIHINAQMLRNFNIAGAIGQAFTWCAARCGHLCNNMYQIDLPTTRNE